MLLAVVASCGGNGKQPIDPARADGGDAAGMNGSDGGGGGGTDVVGTSPVSEECARQACNAGVSDLCCPSSCSAATDIDCAGCGNGRLEAGEICDPAGSCPQSCAQLKCQMQRLKSEGTCAAVCVPAGNQTACVDGDECCPDGCTAANDRDCTSQCGNGTLEPGELCDPLTTCPQTCPMQGCTLLTLVDAGTCLAHCEQAGQETQCRSNDGCCPGGCTAANDSDCGIVCGNGAIEGRETCDPLASCPSACPAMGCRLRTLVNGGTCTAACIDAGLQTTCQSGDGCCPVACNNTNDSDCPALCGNSVIETGETCDPISSCMDRERACVSDAATTRTRMGDPGRCTFTCMESMRTCGPTDGACPPGCGPIQDRDCPGCGNGVMEINETCDPVTVCLERQTACVSDQSTVRTPSGDPAACSFTCIETLRPCGPVDGNCPAGCTPTQDADCAGCGNGTLDPGETCDPVSVCEQRAAACVSDAGTMRTPMGDTTTCRFTCQETPRTCGPADNFCPPNCGPTQDRDCAGCGNGRVETGETCDPCRPEDARACVGDLNTIRTPSGSVEACTFACTVMPRPCQSGDGFCPGSCTRANDADCPPGPGDTCTEGATCGAGSCVDGRCCVQTCATCQSCTGQGGTCVAIAPGQPDNFPARACVAPAMCDGQGNCVTPECRVTVTPASQNFGSVAVGAASTAFPFMVESQNCTTGVTVNLGNPRDFTLQPHACERVAPGNPCRLTVVFNPVAGGARSGVLNVVPAMGQPTSSTLTGTGLIAQLVWKPDMHQFGRVMVGMQEPVRLSLTNVGTAATAPLQFVTQPPFSAAKTDCQVLTPNQQCIVEALFAPTAPGEFTAPLIAQGGNGVTATAQLAGTGAERGRQPLTITPPSAGFGRVIIGEKSQPVEFTVRTTVPLTDVVSRSTSAEFVIDRNGCPGTLPAGGSCTITVVFVPAAPVGERGGNGSTAIFLQVQGRDSEIVRAPMTYTASSSLSGTAARGIIVGPGPRPTPGTVAQ